MNATIIGTNGLLATQIGLFCNKNNIEVTGIGREKPEGYCYNQFEKINLIDEQIEIAKLLASDIIFYTAGAGIQSNLKDSPNSIYHLNAFVPVTLSEKLLENKYAGTLVTFGSCFEIGNNDDNKFFTEKDLISSILEVPNNYCISKRMFTRYAASTKEKSYKHLHLILPTIYGEKESTHRLIPYTIIAIKRKELMQFTKGDQLRQYIYVGDIPQIIFDLISKEQSGVFNIAGTESYTVRQIVEMIYSFYNLEISEDLFGKAERTDIGMKNLQLDTSKLDLVLPNITYTTFKESLKLYDKWL